VQAASSQATRVLMKNLNRAMQSGADRVADRYPQRRRYELTASKYLFDPICAIRKRKKKKKKKRKGEKTIEQSPCPTEIKGDSILRLVLALRKPERFT